MKNCLFLFTFILLSIRLFGQDTSKQEIAKADYSLDAVKYYFKSSENSHLSSREQNWSFSFSSTDKKKLQKLLTELTKDTKKYTKIDFREGKYIFILTEKIKYNPESLYNRTQQLNNLASSYGVENLSSFYVDTIY